MCRSLALVAKLPNQFPYPLFLFEVIVLAILVIGAAVFPE
jgi:hypothetical protein